MPLTEPLVERTYDVSQALADLLDPRVGFEGLLILPEVIGSRGGRPTVEFAEDTQLLRVTGLRRGLWAGIPIPPGAQLEHQPGNGGSWWLPMVAPMALPVAKVRSVVAEVLASKLEGHRDGPHSRPPIAHFREVMQPPGVGHWRVREVSGPADTLFEALGGTAD